MSWMCRKSTIDISVGTNRTPAFTAPFTRKNDPEAPALHVYIPRLCGSLVYNICVAWPVSDVQVPQSEPVIDTDRSQWCFQGQEFHRRRHWAQARAGALHCPVFFGSMRDGAGGICRYSNSGTVVTGSCSLVSLLNQELFRTQSFP